MEERTITESMLLDYRKSGQELCNHGLERPHEAAHAREAARRRRDDNRVYHDRQSGRADAVRAGEVPFGVGGGRGDTEEVGGLSRRHTKGIRAGQVYIHVRSALS